MKKNFSNNSEYINRELSWIEFNKRVLNVSENPDTPLFERLKFVAITSSNFDEFFMVRVGSLNDQVNAGFNQKDPSGMTPLEQIENIFIYAKKLIDRQYKAFNDIQKELLGHNLKFASVEELSEEQRDYLQRYYIEKVYPVLTPILVDKRIQSPLVFNKSLNVGVLLENEKHEKFFGTVQVPSVLGRLVEVPGEGDMREFVSLEEIIKLNLEALFSGHRVVSSSCYRITRNADLTLDEEGAEDLLETIEESIKLRKWGAVVKLEVESGVDEELRSQLVDLFELSGDYVVDINGYIDLSFLMKFTGMQGYEQFKYKREEFQMHRAFKSDEDIFRIISKEDVLLHHPFESFDPVLKLVESAAKDKNVLAIKQVLYRVSGNSPIVDALVKAAESGKQVTVLVELKARFDEENNINWARRLEKAGCHVIYGIVGLKTHCKILLVVRMEETGIKRYVHLGTGNYNDDTAKLYTDIGYFTCNPQYGSDASRLFNMLSGHSKLENMYKLSSAPIDMRRKFERLIDREISNAQAGKKSRIACKLNSLVDYKMIKKLYEASNAGVKVDLVIRGICCLVPNIKDQSENITVRSIVGRYLEHSRIYYFYNDGDEEVFISSADWMTRNLDRRVELLVPVEDEESVEKLKNIIEINLKDNVNAKSMSSDGRYMKFKGGDKTLDSQKYFQERSVKENSIDKKLFKPKYSGINIG
ncbi:polyphosphate kinase [Andreesenia angusta]|uniref:Polyphosphate kinase n=1 Tax=Andreesenia angusta TaxID=39480 RepID=A0A1S1V7I1_9FIRM|nr:polyphosphate kinase 1 [Andreesenia angusta]OHW62586.1 polyphosphate kinase [Andreesenia angusta]